MNRRCMFAFTLVAALVLALVPPWLAWREARRQAYGEQAQSALGYARAMLRRLDDTVDQSLTALTVLSPFAGDPCSPGAQAQMQRLVLVSTYIKAVGHVRDGVLVCSSLGERPFPLGTHTLQASQGVTIYSNIPVADKRSSALIAMARAGFAVLFHSDLPLDAGSAMPGMSLAVLHLERRLDEPVSMATGFIDRRWVARLGRQGSATFTDGRYLVTVLRSTRTASAAVVAVPLAYVDARAEALAVRLVSTGLVLGVALAAVLLLLARQQTSLAASLGKGLRRNEFFLVYQPIVELRSGRCIGVEALLRWRRSSGELIGPDLFVPLAEQSGSITRLTERVLQLVEQDMQHYLATRPHFHVALNLSVHDLHSTAIIGRLDAMLARGAVKAANLVVEITERGILDVAAAHPVVDALRARGIRVAIDDFGTGYAGLSYLQALQVDALKIDRSFIEAIGTCAPTNQVVGHIITMASAMELVMVAEGIETDAQADYLRAHGVQFGQGWLFGKPQRFADLAGTLAAAAGANA